MFSHGLAEMQESAPRHTLSRSQLKSSDALERCIADLSWSTLFLRRVVHGNDALNGVERHRIPPDGFAGEAYRRARG